MDSRKKILFFPTAACRNVDGTVRVPIHGWIYRPTEVSRLRRAGLAIARRWVKLRHDASAETLALFSERFAPFLADNERGERITISLGGRRFVLKKSRPDGHFHDAVTVSMPAGFRGGRLSFHAVTPDGRTFDGHSLLLPEEGLSVISDIDDTVKITNVVQPRELLRNTFGRPFACVPEMGALYRRWQREENAAFHYVSASPWHLYPALMELLRSQHFPEGTWHLRDFRLAGIDLPKSLRPSHRIKAKHVAALMACYPRREFILVGDSGESDARLYAQAAMRNPGRVRHIYIRDIGGEAASGWHRWLKELPSPMWTVFRDPSEIAAAEVRG